MNVWTNIQLIFNNREIALLFWITLTIFLYYFLDNESHLLQL